MPYLFSFLRKRCGLANFFASKYLSSSMSTLTAYTLYILLNNIYYSLLLAYPAPSIYLYSFFIPCGVADIKSCKATTPSRLCLYTAVIYSIKMPGTI